MSMSSGLSRLAALVLIGVASLAIPGIFADRLVGPEATPPAAEAVSDGPPAATADQPSVVTPVPAAPADSVATAKESADVTAVSGNSDQAGNQSSAAVAASAAGDGSVAAPVAAAEVTDGAAVGAPTLAGWLSVADLNLGEKINRQCAVCHSFDEGGGKKIGPNLWDIVGAKQAAKADFDYSDAFAKLNGEWSFEELDRFLAAPQDYAPGTRMTFPGLRRPADRAAVIAWLRERSNAPRALPEASPEEMAAVAGAQTTATETAAAEVTPPAPAEPVQPDAATEAPAAAADANATAGEPQQAAVPPAENLADLLKSADASVGEKIAKKCAACHSFDKGGQAKVGPNLWDVVGAKQAKADSYKYSDALKSLGGEWTYEALDKFLASPKEYASGTKMSFPGLKSAEERAAVIGWLRTLSDSPRPLP